MNQWMDIHQTCMAIQGRRNDFDIGEACLTIAEDASVKGRAGERAPPSRWEGGLPEKILKFMTPVDAF